MIHPAHDATGALDVFTATPAEIRQAGLAAVERALGPVGLARFLQLYESGQGDYTAERDAVVGGLTMDDTLRALDARREAPAE
jgi:hypothetical protein